MLTVPSSSSQPEKTFSFNRSYVKWSPIRWLINRDFLYLTETRIVVNGTKQDTRWDKYQVCLIFQSSHICVILQCSNVFSAYNIIVMCTNPLLLVSHKRTSITLGSQCGHVLSLVFAGGMQAPWCNPYSASFCSCPLGPSHSLLITTIMVQRSLLRSLTTHIPHPMKPSHTNVTFNNCMLQNDTVW